MQVGDITNPDAAANGKPLDGVRVLAIEQMQSLPYATQLLARMGAEVIKVEHPTRGDLGRSSLPAVTDASGAQMGATFLRNNLSKRSIALDLKSPQAQDIVRRLAPRFDVVAENFKAGTMNRFGLGYADLAALAPELIYLSVSGFGNLVDTPYGDWPAFAPIAEAMSGLYTFNRGPDDELKVSPMGALGDTGTGIFAVIGVLAALRHRDRTGFGQYVDVSMFDAMVAFADIVPNYASMGKDPRTPSALINHGFPIAAGEVVVQVGREPQFAILADLVGHPEWVDDPRFATRDGWVRDIEVLRAGVAAWAGDRSTIEVAEALAGAGIAAAPVFEAADVIADPHVAARDMLVAIPTPDGGDVLTAGNPVKLSAVSEGPDTAPPTLGQDTDEVLRTELGLDDAELEQLRADGVIG
jgi:crotonobetainyl-CoA:carnitine CoA-transferase CaiB-like acyl-CoA transferase